MHTILSARYTGEEYWAAGLSVFEIVEYKFFSILNHSQQIKLSEWIFRANKEVDGSLGKEKHVPKTMNQKNPLISDNAPITNRMTPAPLMSIEEILRNLFGSNIPAEFMDTSSIKPASRDALFNLRIHTICQREENEGASCAVCLDEFEVGNKVKKMPCNHLFHNECLLTWLGKQNTCPACRHELPMEKQTWDLEEFNIRSNGIPQHGMYS